MLLKRVAGVILLFFNILSFALAQSSDRGDSVEQEIKKLEQERLNAYLRLDSSALERIMSDGVKLESCV